MCYQPLLAKPIICKVAGRWRFTESGHEVYDLAAEVYCDRLNAL